MSTHGCTCWEPGIVEDPDCPRHRIVARLAIDDEVDRLSDAAADRADTIVDRYDPDDREPMGGDHLWAEDLWD